MSASRFLTADEATETLGISKNTLYAYVSRGMIRSEAATGSRRTKKYHAEDVRRLEEQKALRRNPPKAARSALDFGLPVLASSLTLIEGGRFFYAGCDACQLARTHSLRDVAALLWDGTLGASLPDGDDGFQLSQDMLAALPACGPVERLQALLPVAATRDDRAFDFSREGTARTGGRLLRLMQRTLTGADDALPLDFAEAFQRCWDADAETSQPLLRAALVLCADHELNATAMAARCAASAGASPYGVAGAGLAVLRGRHHAGGMARIEALLKEAATPDRLQATLSARLRRGDAVPGFGHRLYPSGDPRARLLFEMLREAQPDAQGTAFLAAAMETGPDRLGQAPTVDFALVALRRALGLPEEAPLALFAVGRTVGWIGHAIEQYEAERPIRPRATYTGPPPSN